MFDMMLMMMMMMMMNGWFSGLFEAWCYKKIVR